MWPLFRHHLTAVLDLFLPPACLLCGKILPTGIDCRSLCDDCASAARPLAGQCSRCAQPFVSPASHHTCGACLDHPPAFTAVHASGAYQGSLKDAIHHLKYRNRVGLAEPLGHRLSQHIKTTVSGYIPHRVVPVPLHVSRLRQRGYNQALEIARPLAQELGTNIDTALLRRTRKTPQQQGLNAVARRHNLRDAFALTGDVRGKMILLVDDVMTTGETVRECSRVLMKGGAAEVRVAVVGRA